VISTPCPTFSRGGLGSGREDLALLLDTQTCFGRDLRSEYDLDEMGLDSYDQIDGDGCGCMYEDLGDLVGDPRTKLFIENIRWALHAPDLEWLALEEVATCLPLFEDIAAELYSAGWESVNVVVIDAQDYGVASKRERVFLYARHYEPCTVSWLPSTPIPQTTMAEALGWGEGVKVYTRGNRTTSGGNAYSADKPSWCLTKTSRSWKIGAPDGPELTAGQAGLLNGFPPDYPWQQPGISRTSQFQRIADVVSPVLGAVILGCATNTEWETPVRRYLEALYSPAARLKAFAA
jgi:DNA (cytosine-5)-methyltransferase 1